MNTYDPTPILDRFPGLKWDGTKGNARCPAHADDTASLTLKLGDKGAGLVLYCHAGCGRLDILDAVGLTMRDLFPPRDQRGAREMPPDFMPCTYNKDWQVIPGHGRIADYLYRWPDGAVEFGVSRCRGKGTVCQGFRQWHPDSAKKWGRTWSLTRTDGSKVDTTLPFHLPELLKAKADGLNIWIVGGEKDALRLSSLGYPATCNAGGETTGHDGKSKWTAQHAKWLDGADCTVVADRDDTGRRWAHAVATTLLPIARSIEIVQAAFGKDVSDHLAEDGPHVTEWLRANGLESIHADGTPRTKLGVRHLVALVEPKPAPPAVSREDCEEVA